MSRLLVALLAAAKRVASTNPRLEALARWFHGHLSGRYRRDPTRLIAKAIQSDDAVIVQIGSSDGFLGDPIYPLLARNPGWTCLFVEPVPHVFAKLRALHGQDSRHKFENSAINDGSRMTFHYLDPSVSEACGGGYAGQLGSFNRTHIIRHLGSAALPYIREVEIQGMTLSQLLGKHGIDRIDLLHVDAEGYDWQIVRQLDLNRFRPTVILFEHLHLAEDEHAEAQRTLGAHYEMRDIGADMFCRRFRDPL